ncbi:MAG: hypothetical protein HY657_20245 [Acidobacteria bacterium]|nr:hypothetical protein [Acidobacteriota bacterium]
MIKTVIKLLIVLAVLNAVAHAGLAAWDYYQLRDEAQQLIVFGAQSTTAELHNRILAKAEELEVPLEPANLDVQREGNRTFVYASYTQPIELFPRFTYPVDLSFTVDAFSVEAFTPDDVRR